MGLRRRRRRSCLLSAASLLGSGSCALAAPGKGEGGARQPAVTAAEERRQPRGGRSVRGGPRQRRVLADGPVERRHERLCVWPRPEHALHAPCTRPARALHPPCTRPAHALLTPCTRLACALDTACNVRRRGLLYMGRMTSLSCDSSRSASSALPQTIESRPTCTRHARSMHAPRTRHARAMRTPCARHARTLQHAPRMHHAHAMHAPRRATIHPTRNLERSVWGHPNAI